MKNSDKIFHFEDMEVDELTGTTEILDNNNNELATIHKSDFQVWGNKFEDSVEKFI